MLWGAFNNASTAMQVFTTDLGSISQNIANVNTTGYKRQEMMFSTMMSEHHAAPTSYLNGLNIFGVQATQRNLIDAQGVITPSSTWSDLAINGRGFFMVAPPTTGGKGGAGAGASSANVPSTVDVGNPASVMYTRDGAFHRAYGPDTDSSLARSYFLNSQGGYLLGWMADDTGTIPTNGTLEPVYTLAPRPIANNGTAAVDAASTLKPTSVTMPGRMSTEGSILANLPRDSKIGGSRTTVSVADGTGAPQTVNLDWTRTGAYTYSVTASAPEATSATPNTWTVTFDDSGQVVTPTGSQAVNFAWKSGAATGNLSLTTMPPRYSENVPLKVYDESYTEHTATLRFERYDTNKWYMFTDAGDNSTASSAPVDLVFDDMGKLTTPTDGLTSLTMSWAAVPASGTTPAKPAGTATIAMDLSKVTQLAGSDLYIGNVDQNGYGKGTLLGTSFNETGELTGYYDNGRTRTLFKVPVANFVAENSLEAVSGTLFRRTAAAGDISVTAIEDSVGEGRFSTSSLESSTVEIEDEFTRMIMTQKAYSTNAQVFKTADEMTTTARDLKN